MKAKAIEWTGTSITGLSLHKRRINPFNLGYGLEHIPFIILYGVVFYYCYGTIGEPYQNALMELKTDYSDLFSASSASAERNNEGLAASALSGGIIQEETNAEDLFLNELHEKGKSLPNPYLPSLVPLLALLGVTIGHVLMILLQVWSVTILTLIKYRQVSSLDTAEYVRIFPKAFRGKPTLIRLEKSASHGLFFVFQKRKYIAEQNDDDGRILFRKLQPPVKAPLGHYLSATGIHSPKEVLDQTELYGTNTFSIPQPSFKEMYIQQLLEPLTVFQIFSVFLWVLDEYWQYPLFTLAMILLFEGVTVLTRVKNLAVLRGMGNESNDIQVFRGNQWTQLSSEQLLPGDIISLAKDKEIVPCDGLLLLGTAVMNEATLTGESIPQMKEAMSSMMSKEDLEQSLDMKSMHKVHITFGGTTLMQHSAENSSSLSASTTSSEVSAIPSNPDQGCLVYVLRTGFSSSQGKLVRMIENSSGKVTGNTRDALGLAFLLLIFAIISATYVMHEGIAAKGKVTFELVLRCVLIITSVVPAELPMQTSLAVNSALLCLVKCAIFCTEPFRISLAGKVDICLFDKTGTITTDQLTAIGVVSAEHSSDDLSNVPLQSMMQCSFDASMVLAGCHSLVEIDGQTIGDPVEEAALRAIDFEFHPKSRTCEPKNLSKSEKAHLRVWEAKNTTVQLLHRNHFASKLQRMSVICRIKGTNPVIVRSLVKGSPEIIETLLTSVPRGYHKMYQELAQQGMRVLALASRDIDIPAHIRNEEDMNEYVMEQPRSFAETELTFAGFAAFQCLVRKDSGAIIEQLQSSSHLVTMITGDALLTGIHVAKEVSICARSKSTLVLKSTGKWHDVLTDEIMSCSSSDCQALASQYNLCCTGQSFLHLTPDHDLWSQLEHIRVFARMTPELKERVMTNLKTHGHHTLMCGDGANDVGALKQADIGMALLSGFGSANAGKGDSSASTSTLMTRAQLMQCHSSVLKKKLREVNINPMTCPREKSGIVDILVKAQEAAQQQLTSGINNNKTTTVTMKKPKAPVAPKLSPEEQKLELARKQAAIEADIAARQARGESFAHAKAIFAFAKKEAEEIKQKKKASGGFAASASNATLANYMDDFEDGEMPMVKLGDASIASSFTSRAPSIKGCVDIIRQGRCALVTTMQMYQILAVNCLISSYSLSVLYLDKVKYSNAQMIALGMISTVASLTLSRAVPLDELSRVRPLTSIFHPALFVSMVGQFGIHLGCMIYATSLAKAHTAEGDMRHHGDHDHVSDSGGDTTKFVPTVMSTVIFLINAVQTVSVCAVNYKGRPFMVR